MSKYKVGDRVRIVDEWKGQKQNQRGKMDKWRGKAMTIREIFRGCYFMNEDAGERGGIGWAWYEEMIAGPTDDQKILITSNGKTTLARLYEGNKVVKRAEANCCPGDTYDFNTGARLAFDRLVEEKKPEQKTEYYSGKVVCVDENGSACFTAGVVYEIKSGIIKSDRGNLRHGDQIKSIDELNCKMIANFIPYKGEAL